MAAPFRVPGFRPGFQFLTGAAAPAAFTMTQLAKANQVYQRTSTTGGGQGKGSGTVVHTINVTTPGSIYARRRSASDGATIVQAAWLVGNVASAGLQTLNVTGVDAPAIGSDAATPTLANDGTFYLDLSGDGVTWTNGTTPIHMGDAAVWWGQSLITYALSRLDAVNIPGTISPYGRVFAQYNGYTPTIAATAWELPSNTGNYKGSTVTEYLRCMVSASGVANGVVGYGVGGTTISLWQTGQANMTLLLSIMAAAGGSFRWEYGMIGHTDSQIASSDSYFQGALTNAWGAVRGGNSYSSPTRTVASVPGVATNTSAATTGDWTMVNVIRQAAKSWAASNSSTYIQPVGIKTVDGTHQTNGVGGGDYLAREIFRSYRAALGLTGSNAGATVTNIARVGTAITLTLSGAVTGAGYKRFRVFDAGNLNAPRALTSTSVSGNTITFNLAVDPGVGAVLDFAPYTDGYVFLTGGTGWDGGAETFFDTNIQADETALGFTRGRQVDFGIIGTITIPAQTPAGAVNAIPAYNMTMTSPVYQTGGTGFGNEFASGTGITTPAMLVPQPPTFTVEGWVSIPTAPTGNIILFNAPDPLLWVGTNTSGQITVQNAVQSATSYTGAGRVFVRMVQNATTRKFYIGTAPGAAPTLVNTVTFGSTGAAYRVEYGMAAHIRSTGLLPTAGTFPIDSLALWAAELSTVAPSASYVGNEANLLALYNFESNGNDSCTN